MESQGEEAEAISTTKNSDQASQEEGEIVDEDANTDVEEVDVPENFFDDLMDEDFFEGLNVVDIWSGDAKKKSATHSTTEVPKSKTDNDDNAKNPTQLNQESPSSKQGSDGASKRRDINKTLKAIKQDKERCHKDKMAKIVSKKLRVVETGLVPPGTEMDVDIKVDTDDKKVDKREHSPDRSDKKAISRRSSDKRNNSASRSHKINSKSPRSKRDIDFSRSRHQSPRTTNNNKWSERSMTEKRSYKPRSISPRNQRSRDNWRAHNDQTARQRKSTSRGLSRTPGKYKRSHVTTSKGAKTFLEELSEKLKAHDDQKFLKDVQDKLNINQYRSNSQLNLNNNLDNVYVHPVNPSCAAPSVQYSNYYVPQPYPAPVPHPYQQQQIPPPNEAVHPPYMVYPEPVPYSNVQITSYNPVPAASFNTDYNSPSVEGIFPAQQPSQIYPNNNGDWCNYGNQNLDPFDIKKSQLQDELFVTQLFDNKDVTFTQILELKNKHNKDTNNTPVDEEYKTRVLTRCHRIINYLTPQVKMDNIFHLKMDVKVEMLPVRTKYCSPLKKLPGIALKYTTPSNDLEFEDKFPSTLSGTLKQLLLKFGCESVEVEKKYSPTIDFQNNTGPLTSNSTDNKKLKHLNKMVQTVSNKCASCEKRDEKEFSNVAIQTDDLSTSDVSCQVYAEDISRKGNLRTQTLAHFTPAQLRDSTALMEMDDMNLMEFGHLSLPNVFRSSPKAFRGGSSSPRGQEIQRGNKRNFSQERGPRTTFGTTRQSGFKRQHQPQQQSPNNSSVQRLTSYRGKMQRGFQHQNSFATKVWKKL